MHCEHEREWEVVCCVSMCISGCGRGVYKCKQVWLSGCVMWVCEHVYAIGALCGCECVCMGVCECVCEWVCVNGCV